MQFEMLAGEHGVFTVDFGQMPQEVIDHYTEELSAATDPIEEEAWTLALAGALYQRLLSGDLEHLAGLRWQRLVQLGTAVLAVQRGAVSTAPDGTPLVFSKGPMSLDLGAMPLGLFPAAGAAGSTVPTMELLGSQGSFLEAEALSQVIGGEQITAVTFLTRAVREGQTLTLIDAGNVDAALAEAELSVEAEAHVRAGVAQGKIAWIAESQLPVGTWQTSGYILEDPDTGAAGYFVTFERLVEGLEANIVFHSPQDLDVVTAPIDVVATVDSEALDSWTLSYKAVDEGQPVVLATGSGSVTNATLAQFDPTLLLNGLYDIVLTGRDIAGQSVSGKVSVSVEGSMKVGNFTLSFIDLAIPLSGLDIEVIRTYDSRDPQKGDFGIGWTLDVRQGSYRNNRPPGDGWQFQEAFLPCDTILESKSHLSVVRLSDAEIYRFRLALDRGAPTYGGCFAEASFAFVDGPLPGTTLEILGNREVFCENGGGRVVDKDTFELYEPDRVRLTTRDGRIFELDLEQGVTLVEDLNGNRLTINSAGITHSSGKGIAFTRDAEGRISRMTDPLGNATTYSYDVHGDLVAVTDRAGNPTRFTYDDRHRVLDVRDPRGAQPLRNEYDESGRLVRHLDAFGRAFELGHDLDNRSEVLTNRLGATRVLEYDERGNVVRETDELGKATIRTFDPRDNVLTETDPLQHTITQIFDSANNLKSVRDPLGNTASYRYNARGQVLTVTDPRGKVTTHAYDARGNLESTTDSTGAVSTFTYDDSGNVETETDAGGGLWRFEYDEFGNRTREIDPLGHATVTTYDGNGNRLTETLRRTLADGSTETLTTTFAYDALGRLIRTTAADGSTTSTAYDLLGKVTSRTDELGRITRMDYDLMGRLVQTVHPDDTSETRSYDAEGRLIGRTDRAGRTTHFTYDAGGRLVTTTFADDAEITSAYDDAGRLTATTDARGNTTDLSYDALGRRTAVTDPLGRAQSFGWDQNGNQTWITDARGNTTHFAYDTGNRLTTTTFPDDTTTQISYDALGRQVALTDQAGRISRFTYDALGRLTSVTDALDQVTSYTYDEVGNRITQTDANGNTTGFEYDACGREIARVLPGGARETRSYHPDGTLASHTDFNGRTRTFEYDANRRLVGRVFPDGSTIASAYTPTGQRTSMTDSRGTTTYTYDARDRLLVKTGPAGHPLSYTYDLQGNRTSLSATVGDQVFTTTYTYDVLNRLSTITDAQGKVTTLTYDENGSRAGLAFPNGVTTTYSYDAVNRLTRLATATSVDEVLQSYAYTLGPAGNRLRIDEHDGTSRQYRYDALYRLSQDKVTDPSDALIYRRDFTYDAVGNRLGQTIEDDTGTTTIAWNYDSRDRLLNAASTTYGWDTNGNLVSRDDGGAVTYGWDFENRLTRVTLAGGTEVRTTYDADGNRVRTEVIPPEGPASVVDYLVDTTGLLSHVAAEVVDGGVRTLYTRAGDQLISLFRPPTGTKRYVHANGLGSIRLLSNDLGAVTDRYAYTAFGELLEHQGTDPNPYRFAGEPFDPNVGFYYNRARWLDVGVGRFLNVDPFIGFTTNPLSLHRYLYARMQPLNNTDPDGRLSTFNLTVTLVALGVVAAIGITALDIVNNSSAENRPLTAGEKELTRSVFGKHVQPDKVRVYHTRFVWFISPSRALYHAPDGNIYVHSVVSKSQYQDLSTGNRSVFIHEMAHVWQHQKGVPVMWRRIFHWNYSYTLDPNKTFDEYNIEQQAEIIEDYHSIRSLSESSYIITADGTALTPSELEKYERLIPFVDVR